MAVEPEPVNIEQIIKDILTKYKEVITKKSLKVKFTAKQSSKLNTDRSLLEAISSNLIYNAICYTPREGTITISLRSDKKALQLIVRDTGLGIPKTEQERIFTRFYRGSNITSLGPLGQGLGLYLTKLAVELLGGEISFISQSNRGATFTVELPGAGNQTRAGESYLSDPATQASVAKQ